MKKRSLLKLSLIKKSAVKETSNQTLTVMRPVTIKAIVTDDFKKYLVFEIQEQIKEVNAKLKQLEQNVELFLKENASLSNDERKNVDHNFLVEKNKLIDQIKLSNNRLEEVKNLALNTLFHQGSIDSFVTVKTGDNLFQKLAKAELIVKDGIVVEIKTLA